MSLLLQALKKAEEDKRRRAEMASDAAATPNPSEALPAELEVQFPELNLVADDLSAQTAFESAETVATEIEPILPTADEAEALTGSDWNFNAIKLEEKPEPSPSISQPAPTESFEANRQTTVDIDAAAALPPPVAAVQLSNPPETAPAIDAPPSVDRPPTNATPVAETPAPVIPPAANPAGAQVLAKHLFAKSNKPSTRGLLPWLLLGAGLLLAGMVAWFTWQYRQLTQASPAIDVRAPSAPVASSAIATPVFSPEAIVNESPQADTLTNLDAALSVTPLPKPTGRTLDTIEAKPKSATNITSDSRDLNPPLKFVRQSPHFNAPDPVLMAWQFYQNGDLNQAELLYQKALQTDPRQRDALLGLAAIAQQRGDLAAATAWYQRVLRANPQDESAQAALLMLNSTQLPEHEAVQLEQSGKSNPMVLGQYFAAQQRWSQAQEQFFLAYSANLNSADAALNLAVSLDHLQQTSLAKTYYRKALQAKESIHFDRSKVEQRLAELDAVSGATP